MSGVRYGALLAMYLVAILMMGLAVKITLDKNKPPQAVVTREPARTIELNCVNGLMQGPTKDGLVPLLSKAGTTVDC